MIPLQRGRCDTRSASSTKITNVAEPLVALGRS
jgi:hypothetical protein